MTIGGSRDQRLRALVDTMRAFAEATSDVRGLLDTIASSVARLLGDACVITLLSEDGRSVRPGALASVDDEANEFATALFSDHNLAIEDVGVMANVIRTGEPLLITTIEPQELATRVAHRYAPGVVSLGIHSVISVPLRYRGGTIGSLGLFRFRSGSASFDGDDLAFALGLADHAALAITNARLLESVRRELAERKRAEEETKTFAALAQNSTDLVAMAGFDGQLLFVNAAGRRLLGIPMEKDARQLTLAALGAPEELTRLATIRDQGSWQGDGVLTHLESGALIPTQVSSFVVRAANGDELCFATVQRDMRERNYLEAQLRQAQKMEAVGRLAGGIAHDFNNLVTVILSYTSLLQASLPAGSLAHADADEIATAGMRAAALTGQLLAFSRQQVLAPAVLDLNAVILGMQTIARTLVTDAIEVVLDLGKTGRIVADESQIGQVLANLVVNARDAMPGGGVLTLATRQVVLDADEATRIGATPGPHVVLEVSDTGVGIDEATRANLFEPFFTTKPKGKGTGLGLATVLGIVKQSGGAIMLESELGRGTTFRVYFPRVEHSRSALSLAPSRDVMDGATSAPPSR
jgi:signal transduction histidine kinase